MTSPQSKGIALVTGAAQGIGREIALRLADDGFDVAVNDIDSKAEALASVQKEIKAKGRKTSTTLLLADVSKEDQVEQIIGDVVKELGGLDVMVANAGICIWKSLLETTEEIWDRQFDVNAKGVFFCYKHAGRQMIKQGRGGRIIGASSVVGKQGFPSLAGYTATKFAVRGLTQAAAREFGPHKITVNAYAPGAIETPMLEYIDIANAESTGGKRGDLLEAGLKLTPLGYRGTPTEIASLVSYLASKEAHFITGQSISCNGGTFFD
ncbi:acetoin reductase family protein [Pluteus cervinus]|uniref:Acetoin reductase family protein n=1 Tax=Pluteus cervinus TaxID=181527 RepID=A0ACD3ALU9_9AGAR|nr:acetoin reductase family protein [Pluteus cervinus]